jgi:hypothetical protein
MQTKLTLRLDAELIARAKAHGRRRGKSVSQMVAEFFRLLDAPTADGEAAGTVTPPLTASLRGSLRDKALDEADYRAHLERRYR